MEKLLLSFLVGLLSLWGNSLPAPEEARFFDRANALYQEGRYSEAIQEYEQLIRLGSREASLYCNLANAHFQTGNLGKTILYYEKARLADPLDAGILRNLQRVTGKKVQPGAAGSLDIRFDDFELIKMVEPGFNLGSLLLLGGSFFYLAGGFNRRGKYTSGLKRTAKLLVFSGGLLLILGGGLYIYLKPDAKAYIVLNTATGHIGPSAIAREAGTLESGEKVAVKNGYRGWFKVKRETGTESWVRQEAVAAIGESGAGN